jgi:hypothetical protein
MNFKQMKKLVIGLILLSVVFTLTAQDLNTQSRNIGTFNEVHAGKGINVTLIEGDREKLQIHIENGVVTDVITEVKGRKLDIKLKTKIYSNVGVQVFVTYKSLKAISASTGAFIKSDGIIRAENLDVKANTGSTIILEVDTKSLSSSVYSSKIEVVGKTEFQKVSVYAGGKYIADQLESKDALVKASTGGDAWVYATNKLDAIATTGGKVIYVGNPTHLSEKGNVQRDQE